MATIQICNKLGDPIEVVEGEVLTKRQIGAPGFYEAKLRVAGGECTRYIREEAPAEATAK